MMKTMKVKLKGTIGSYKNRNLNSWTDLEMFYLCGGGGPDSFFVVVFCFLRHQLSYYTEGRIAS